MISYAHGLLVKERAAPHFERQQLQDVQAVVLAPRKVLRDDAPHLFGPEEAAPFDYFFRQKLVNERAQRAAQPRAHGRAEARLLAPHDLAREQAFGGALQYVLAAQTAQLQARRHARRKLD